MGGSHSNTGKQTALTTIAPTASPAPCFSNKELHLALAFLAGVLLTLLLVALVFLIMKNYRKCHSSPQALDPHSDSLAKLSSTPEEMLTYASVDLKMSEEKRGDLIANHSAGLNSVVYAQIK
ncbi:PREDICTED: transmembrane protein C1orf162 homolog [Miniopterus natalensis]|uniref:transmembrane protein C1orf162 homolog n=1 Tax=Miniopterus natalensis TaxID=291302 RepID=UPI0007A71CDD|nr:PREDICTED: transmembrane protein C1orf162 homolog [Miniopterus natalensis]